MNRRITTCEAYDFRIMNILVRNLSEKTMKELRKQAEENNRSLAMEVKAILDES